MTCHCVSCYLMLNFVWGSQIGVNSLVDQTSLSNCYTTLRCLWRMDCPKCININKYMWRGGSAANDSFQSSLQDQLIQVLLCNYMQIGYSLCSITHYLLHALIISKHLTHRSQSFLIFGQFFFLLSTCKQNNLLFLLCLWFLFTRK